MKISSKLNGLPTIKLSQIEDLQGNLKDLNKTDFEKLKTRIEKHGFKYPLYLWKHKGKYYNLDGNQRKRVIMSVWGDIELPYIEIEAKNEKDAKKEILAISSQYGKVTKDGFDEFAFDFELEDWAEVEMETTFDGWMDKEIPEAEEDDYEEPDDLQVDVVLGDLITFEKDGKELHRLLCGDSTDSDAVEKVVNGEKADMVFTDPPYGIKIVNSGSKKVGGGGLVEAKQYSEIIGDDTTDTAKDFYNTCISLGMENFIIWGGNYFTDFLSPSMCWLIWDKENTGNFADVEMAWTSFDKSEKLYKWLWNGMSRKGERSIEGKTRVHPTQKPVGLFVNIFNDFQFDICFDGFLGSGSTMVAAHQLNRKCYGVEIDPRYCQVIIDRMQKLDPNLEVKINGEVYAKKEAENVEQS